MSTNPKGASGPTADQAALGAHNAAGAPTMPKPLNIGSHTRPSAGPVDNPKPQADGAGNGSTGGNFQGQTPPSGGPSYVPAGGRNPGDKESADAPEEGASLDPEG